MPLISVCLASNRPCLWNEFYNTINRFSEDIEFEIIIAGPQDANFELPSNMRHIKTGNIKVPQCHEIAMRNTQGDLIIFISDDNKFWETGGLSHLYKEYDNLCNVKGDNNLILLSKKKDRKRVCDMLFSRAETNQAPIVGLEGGLYHKDLLTKIEPKIDIRFVGTIWDSDLGMRFHDAGVQLVKSSYVWMVEHGVKGFLRLNKATNAHDIPVLHSFWVKKAEKNEIVPSKETWCYMQDKKHVLSKKRLTEVIGYEDKDILTKSQGPKTFGRLSWD